MSTTNAGAAREVAPGRLARFEDAADIDETPISLPPRRRSSAPAQAPLTPVAPAPVTPAPAPTTPVQDAVSPAPAAPAAATSVAPAQPSTQTRRPPKAAKGPEDRVRPSNVHIPVALLDPLTAKCRADGLSHGEVIIVAIEAAYPQLKDLIHPPAVAGGSLFASRRSRAARATDGPLTPLNYRLREGDFATLDQLVEEFGASSRGHLITVSLLHYFHDQLNT